MVETYCAPATRSEREALQAAREAYLRNPLAQAVLNAIPDYAVIINQHRQVIAANESLLTALGSTSIDEMIGFRPGEVVGCVHATDAPGGCGTGKACIHCGGVEAMMECLQTQSTVTRECRVTTNAMADGGALNLEVKASFIPLSGDNHIVLVMRDISAEKRRRALERVFFHDVLNTASCLRMATQLLVSGEADAQMQQQLHETLLHSSIRLIDEIQSQRELLAAEQGELRLRLAEVSVAEALRGVYTSYQHYSLAQHCELALADLPDATLVTDPTILQRVLDNLLKNAVEATTQDGTVTMSAKVTQQAVALSVHNPGVMPPAVQLQLFQRAFSTKGEPGRGIGTYSIKLFTERYLGGKVSFRSEETTGTTFTITLPRQLTLPSTHQHA